MDERRQHPRHDVTQPIMGNVNPRTEIRVINISESGLLVESASGLPPAGICELTLHLPSGETVVKAKVVRCRASMVKTARGGTRMVFRAGLAFDEKTVSSPDIKKVIAEICSTIGDAEMTGQLEFQEGMQQAM